MLVILRLNGSKRMSLGFTLPSEHWQAARRELRRVRFSERDHLIGHLPLGS
ncbi:hypothetical protein L1049_022646 [Liquidambar formosana]|uniref:Uncharacterized protein n=1 Tax=Liquidambar formosana TaxID=63359 RepID=A0AAP0RCS1_LIQFO